MAVAAGVWYFTFGANMNSKTLERRGIAALASTRGSLPGFSLAFTYEGYDGVEPRFANIEPIDEQSSSGGGGGRGGSGGGSNHVVVQGVAHLLSAEHMLLLDKFEGAGQAYERFETTFVQGGGDGSGADDDGGPEAHRSSSSSSSSFAVQAYRALPSHAAARPGLPSRRYRQILADGAAENGLPAAYVRALLALPCFECECAGFALPAAPEGAPRVVLEDVRGHGYGGGGGGEAAAAVWVAMGGLVFDVSGGVAGRAMLQNMSGGDSTIYVLKMWATAFGTGVDAAIVEGVVSFERLALEQQGYVAAWARHLAARFPIVALLRPIKITNDTRDDG